MTWLTSILGSAKVWWPILSLVISLVSGMHAASSKAAAQSGDVSVSSQEVHVIGAGALSGVALLAGAAGVVSNHKSAATAPSVAPAGVDPVLHQLDVAHSALIKANATDAEFNGLNELIKLRKNKPAPKATTS